MERCVPRIAAGDRLLAADCAEDSSHSAASPESASVVEHSGHQLGEGAEALAGHLEEFGEGSERLIFTNEHGKPINRTRYSDAWRPAVKAAGTPGAHFHDLRHHYASVLIQAGLSVKVVQQRLGDATATETLGTYAHLWPADEDRTRAAIDSVWASPVSELCQAKASEN